MKPGYKTTEFWINAIVQIVGAVLAILAFKGVLSGEEKAMWQSLAEVLAAAVIPVVMGLAAAYYTKSRTDLKKFD